MLCFLLYILNNCDLSILLIGVFFLGFGFIVVVMIVVDIVLLVYIFNDFVYVLKFFMYIVY